MRNKNLVLSSSVIILLFSLTIVNSIILNPPKALSQTPISSSLFTNNTYHFVKEWGSEGIGDGQFSYPSDIAVDSADNIFVVDGMIHRIQKFDSNGNFITKWGSFGN